MHKLVASIFTFVFCFSTIYAQNTPYKIIKEARGEGWNYRNARLNAFRDAIERAYGVQIDSNSSVKNFSEIADTILSTSKGVIQSYHGEKYQVQSDGSCFVTFSQVIVSESAKSIGKEIAQISEDLNHLNCPPIGIKMDGVDPDFISYIQTFLINEIGVKVVPPQNQECELIIRPYLRLEVNQKMMMIRGDVINKKGEIVSSCSNFKLLYNSFEDIKFASDILTINLLMQFVMTPTIKVTNIRSYMEAEELLAIIKSTSDVVTKCSLKTYQKNVAEFDVNIKGNLRQLCSKLVKTGAFDSQQVTMNEFSRVLILSYLGGAKLNTFPPVKETPPVQETIIQPVPPIQENPRPKNTYSRGSFPGFTYAGRKTFSCGSLRYTVELYDHQKTGLRFISLPPIGEELPISFLMGSPTSEPKRSKSEIQHQVRLSKRFLISQTEVTQGVWERIMGNNPSFFKEGDTFPVEMVNWAEANEFCRRTGLLLPTEAQFEYASRGGSQGPFCFGTEINTDQANFNGMHSYKTGGLAGQFRQSTVAVGTFPPNAFGLYDMHGNVMEWCQDWYANYSKTTQVDPSGPKTGSSYRVLRGGGWSSRAERIRSSSRSQGKMDQRRHIAGFRVCYISK